MENNNIGDFFRKRLDDDMPNEDWANPDLEIDSKVLNQITQPNKPISKGWGGVILKSGIGILLLLMGGYIIYLNQELSVAKNKIIGRTDIVENAKPESNIQDDFNTKTTEIKDALIAKLEAEKENLLFEKEKLNQLNEELLGEITKQSINPVQRETVKINSENYDAIKTLREEKEILLAENQRLNQLTDQLLNENNVLEEQQNTHQQSYTQMENENNELKDSLSLLSSLVVENMNSETEKILDKEPIIPEEKIDAKNHKRFALGYEYSRQKWDIPINRTFAEQRLVSENGRNENISTNVHGLNFAFSPKQNWWIKSGLRFTQINIESTYNMGLAYSATNEITDLISRTTTNTLNVKTYTPFSISDNSVTVLFEEDRAPEEGSLLEYQAEDNLSINSWQIPIGLERQFNAGRTFLFIQGGVQLNSISIKEYTFRTTILDNERNPLNIVRESLDAQGVNNKLFLNIYGEFGIEQPIFQEWYLRAALNYSYNFLKNNSSNISNQAKTGTAFRLGLNYRF
ncbi:MAG: hypothetical protein NXI23_23130 [Bacteroidetes bacterium]|jgi:hypothetical protein|nr:hypothetical protein [Bacteroidota bacterium]